MSSEICGIRIGVDIGGTFTDMVLVSGKRIDVVKVPTVPSDPAAGVLSALEAAAYQYGSTVADLLGACEFFVHGSTVATNTVLEGKGAKVGLVTTAGFRDALEIRRGLRKSPWSHREPFASVLVPRFLRIPIGGRIERDGSVSQPVSEVDIDAAARTFVDHGVESIAVSLYNGYLNAGAERAVAIRLLDTGVRAPVSLSSVIAPLAGEYERTSTAVMNAYIAPKTVSYLTRLAAKLRENGLRPSMMLVQSNGGAISVDEVAERPVSLLLSGPASGVGALRYFQDSIGSDNLISMEIGGTSCDVVLIDQGRVELTDELDIGGYRVMTPSVEVNTIGAGGGTIARVDRAGMLAVGPDGAGSRPGPACFGFGGREPTVTDAQVILGRLAPGPYAGGSIVIDMGRARQVVEERIALPLGISCEQAAAGIIRLTEQKLLDAVQRLSIERGYDPARFTLVAAGGAGPMHGTSVARELGCRQVYVPRISGAFCALGMLHVNARHDFVRTFVAPLGALDAAELERLFREMADRAISTLRREGFALADVVLEHAVSVQYPGQQSDLQIPLPDGHLDRAEVRREFERLHRQFYGHDQPDGSPIVTKVRVAGIGLLPRLPTERQSLCAESPRSSGTRQVWIDAARGWMLTPVYSGSELQPGMTLRGPAIVNETTTTILIGAGDKVRIDAAGNYLATLRLAE